MPSTRTRSQAAIDFPRRKSARLPAKSHRAAGTPDATNVSADATANPCAVRLAPCPAAPLSPRSPVLPLSPRKRLGDDNLCNVPCVPTCSPSKCSRKENRGRRLLFGEQPVPVSPEKLGEPALSPRRQGQETPRSSEQARERARLFRQEGSRFQEAKRLLHTAVPECLLARERETSEIKRFLREHVCAGRPGSLYISGAPGTGKTACVSRVLQDCQGELASSKTVVLNCMSLSSSQGVFAAVASQLGLQPRAPARELARQLEQQLTAKGPMVLLVLDELDQLDSKGQDVLYTVFEWPWLPGSRLVLVGMANALDLTERGLARLQARPGCRPRLLPFAPYTREQLVAILQERLRQVAGDPVLDGSAVQFCARKVSAVSGDARKALDICRRAVELVERDARSQTVLKPLPPAPCPAGAAAGPPGRAGLPQVARVLAEVYGERMAPGGSAAHDSFPLQQKLLLCSLLLLARHLGAKEVTLGKLHDTYSKVCRRQRLAAAGQAECLALAALLEARGVLELKRAKDARLAKVSLKLQPRELEQTLQDAALVGSVLAQGLP
ncbi:cell division control protein 6 homolog [Nothoprocta perdicaria]|uniref:Cell division control protein n=1 Tax=Nothoprocta perdicaria TaxID=30464 RepID=A0A8C7EE83_NOTPE|nr:cell division control protein 6 homolog [Nothoprocta perdicaria]